MQTFLRVRPFQEADWPIVQRIYTEGIATGIATFETQAPEWATWDAKYLNVCRLVAVEGDEIKGWAALTPFSKREVYQGVAEVSLYIAEKARGSGIGLRLLLQLVQKARLEGFWTLQAAIFPENKASIHIHEKAGFRKVGVREKIAQRDGAWKDNVLMEIRF